jgi:hypothetical protein
MKKIKMTDDLSYPVVPNFATSGGVLQKPSKLSDNKLINP